MGYSKYNIPTPDELNKLKQHYSTVKCFIRDHESADRLNYKLEIDRLLDKLNSSDSSNKQVYLDKLKVLTQKVDETVLRNSALYLKYLNIGDMCEARLYCHRYSIELDKSSNEEFIYKNVTDIYYISTEKYLYSTPETLISSIDINPDRRIKLIGVNTIIFKTEIIDIINTPDCYPLYVCTVPNKKARHLMERYSDLKLSSPIDKQKSLFIIESSIALTERKDIDSGKAVCELRITSLAKDREFAKGLFSLARKHDNLIIKSPVIKISKEYGSEVKQQFCGLNSHQTRRVSVKHQVDAVPVSPLNGYLDVNEYQIYEVCTDMLKKGKELEVIPCGAMNSATLLRYSSLTQECEQHIGLDLVDDHEAFLQLYLTEEGWFICQYALHMYVSEEIGGRD